MLSFIWRYIGCAGAFLLIIDFHQRRDRFRSRFARFFVAAIIVGVVTTPLKAITTTFLAYSALSYSLCVATIVYVLRSERSRGTFTR